ncbi:hypothetical protein ACVIDN_007552 [Rhizobium brockwellii]
MDARVIREVLSPGVQHRDEADLRTQLSFIRSKLAQRLGDGAKEDRVNGILFLEGDCGDLLR